MKAPSLRVRLSVWYVAGLGLTLLCFGVLVDRALVRTFDEELNERLASAAGVVQFALRDMSRDAAAAKLLLQLQFVEVDVAIFGQGADGSSLPFAGNDSVLAPVAAMQPCHDRPITREHLRGIPHRYLIQCVATDAGLPTVTVAVGASEQELIDARDRMRTMLVLSLLIGVALTALGGHWLSGKAIEPVRRMSERVQRIGSENLSERLPVRGRDGEIAQLATMVNDLFDRLAATVARERQFLANAAHALRTPMAILQGQISEATQHLDVPDAARDGLLEIASVTSHLGRTVEYLLSLANREAGIGSFPLEPVVVDDVVSGTVARLSRLAERRRIKVAWGGLVETTVQANVHIVDQVTQILLENALQYTPEGGEVTVSVQSEDGRGRLAVEDNGPGLETEEFASIFTPFARGSAARRTGSPGSGLGLAVACWMVERCEGTISAERVLPHGARFVVTFPGVAR